MGRQNIKFVYLALLPICAAVMLSGLRPDGFYQRISMMLLTTASMEAAANGGAIGEGLPAH
jgi:hypothetical protein